MRCGLSDCNDLYTWKETFLTLFQAVCDYIVRDLYVITVWLQCTQGQNVMVLIHVHRSSYAVSDQSSTRFPYAVCEIWPFSNWLNASNIYVYVCMYVRTYVCICMKSPEKNSSLVLQTNLLMFRWGTGKRHEEEPH